MIKPSAILLCLATPAVAEAPRVVTDIAPVHSLVANVMAGVGAPVLLLDASMSPHTANLRPSMAAELQAAELVITIGDELTPWLTRRIETLASGAKSLELLESSPHLIEPGEEDDHDDHQGHDDHDEEHADHGDDHHDDEKEHADHGDADDHGHDEEHADADDHADHDEEGHGHAIDPHAWLDPRNAAEWVILIGEALAEIDPDNKDIYLENAEANSGILKQLAGSLEARVETYGPVTFLPYHNAYAYFAEGYGHKSVNSLASNEGVAPSAADIQSARELLADGKVDCVFTEPQYASSLIETTTEGFDVPVFELDPLGAKLQPDTSLYFQVINEMANAFEDCARQQN